ncbi:MAG: hypothetical protein ABL974_03990 [Prosthecobacter sp.]
MNHNDIETTLCAQRWRDPPPEFLQRTLAMALAESRQRSGVLQDVALQNRKPRWLALLTFIPRPLRLPLAACWLLALFFKLTTPESIPQSTLENYAKVPPVTPAQLIAHLELTERLAHELAEQFRGQVPPL